MTRERRSRSVRIPSPPVAQLDEDAARPACPIRATASWAGQARLAGHGGLRIRARASSWPASSAATRGGRAARPGPVHQRPCNRPRPRRDRPAAGRRRPPRAGSRATSARAPPIRSAAPESIHGCPNGSPSPSRSSTRPPSEQLDGPGPDTHIASGGPSALVEDRRPGLEVLDLDVLGQPLRLPGSSARKGRARSGSRRCRAWVARGSLRPGRRGCAPCPRCARASASRHPRRPFGAARPAAGAARLSG